MDIDRVGLFSEMGYITIGDKYKDPNTIFNMKGKNFYVPGSKSLTSAQHGYFTDTYHRICEGEGYMDPILEARKAAIRNSKKNLGKAFAPSNGFKSSCGLGSYYGTIGGPLPALSPIVKPKSPTAQLGKNIVTSPGKKGTGYGYLEVTMNPYPKHLPDPFSSTKDQYKKDYELHKSIFKGGPFHLNMCPVEYFTPNPYMETKMPPVKEKAKEKHRLNLPPFVPSNPGRKTFVDATFEKYPAHSVNDYRPHREYSKRVVNSSGKTFYPLKQAKNRPTNSIMQQNVNKVMNSTNYKTIEKVMTY
ncbi:UPF0602 protein C4orf47 homolog [Argonauta hians]